MTLTKLTAAVCLSSMFAAAPALADSNADRIDPHVSVPYADLNLERSAGIEVLYQRLKRASRQICGSGDVREAGTTRQAQRNRQCYDQSLGSAVEKLRLPELNALHHS